MRALVLAVFIASSVAAETDLPADKVTFTRAELASMQQELEALVRAREEAAYKQGQEDVRQRCASLI